MKSKIVTVILLLIFSAAIAQEPLSLEDCFEAALENSPNVRAARERTVQAKARMIQARGAFLPALSASAAYVRLDEEPYVSMGDMAAMMAEILEDYIPPEFLPPDTGTTTDGEEQRLKMGEDENYDITVTATQPIFTGFGILSGYRMANLGVKAENLSFDSAREDLLLSVEEVYWQNVKAAAFLQTAEKSKQQVSAHVEDLKKLKEQGIISATDLLEAQVQESEMELTVLRAEHGVNLARLSLATLTGLPADSIIIEPDIPENSDRFDESGQVVQSARENNTQLKALDLAWRISDIGVTAANSALYPSLALIGNWHYKKPNRELENDWYDSWEVTAAMNLNIFDWGITLGEIKGAKAARREIEAQREAYIRGLDLQTRMAYTSYIEALEEEKVAKKQVELAEENLRMMRLKFANQVATSTNLLDTQSDLLRAEVNLLTSSADREIVGAKLKRLTGSYLPYFREEAK